MACCEGKHEVEFSAKAELVGMGLSIDLLNELVSKFGSDVLFLVQDALKNGLTKDFVVEMLTRLGPIFLEIAVKLLNQTKTENTPGKNMVHVAAVGSLVGGLLPWLVDKYGQHVVDLLIDLLLKKISH